MPHKAAGTSRSTRAGNACRGACIKGPLAVPATTPPSILPTLTHHTCAYIAHLELLAVQHSLLRLGGLRHASLAGFSADVVGHFKSAHGITFRSLSAFNEPASPAWCLATNCKQVRGCAPGGSAGSVLGQPYTVAACAVVHTLIVLVTG